MLKLFLAIVGLVAAARATALQPLESFLRGARTAATENAESRAARREARADSDAALGRALPGVSLRGTYTRNQFETTLRLPGAGGSDREVTITPRDQLDGAATLEVPLVDLSSFARIGSARTLAAAAARQEASTGLEVESRVSQDYHQLVANLALVAAAGRALDVARSSLRTAERRHDAGAVTRLDVDRARAEVERNVQQLASAELQVSLAARSLASRTGIAPVLEGEPRLEDDLHEEAPLEAFQVPDARIPAVDAATRRRLASEQEARAAQLTLVPSLAATLTGYATDAEGLAGRDRWWQGVVALTWRFDLTTVAAIRAQQAAADGARAREERTRLAARDAIHAAWQAVRTDLARSRSARIQAEVSARAAALALERYDAGEATQLDLLQAQRDAFAADAARIQADADLVNARGQLRIASGESLVAEAGTNEPSRREMP
jgi:outer membrane protein TolC